MPPYKTKLETIPIGEISLNIVSLADKSQFYDPEKKAEKLGISESMWPISGLIWPAGLVLAKVVNQLNLSDLRVLEVGCGIGVASLIAGYKNADITASDYHPLVEPLLSKNAEDNNISGVKYVCGDWHYPDSDCRKFDLIIGSDLLYEENFCNLLSVYINYHLLESGRVILIDPGRKKAGKIKRSMESLGFQYETVKLDAEGNLNKKGYFTQYTFQKKQDS